MRLGIDLGGSHISVGIVSKEGKIIAKQEENISLVEIEPNRIKQEIRDTMLSMLHRVLEEVKAPRFVLESIGIGVPGIVEKNRIKKCSKFGSSEYDLAEEIQKYYQVPVTLENDAVCAAIAEKQFGNLKGIKKSVFLCLGTGIGSTIFYGDKVIASECGHMIIQKTEQRKCHCGNCGCFETYCSMRVFKKNVIKILNLREEISSKELLEIVKENQNHSRVENYIKQYIKDLMIGLENITNMIGPETICLGGSFVFYQEVLYHKLLEKLPFQHTQYKLPNMVLAKLGHEAGIIGASCISDL